MSVLAESVATIERELSSLEFRFRSAFDAAEAEPALRQEYAKILGKKGELTAVLALMRDVPAANRAAIGAKVNAFKELVEVAFASRLGSLAQAARDAELQAQPFDLALPGRLELGRGHANPIFETISEILVMFRDFGFVVATGPEIDLEENTFGELPLPPDADAAGARGGFRIGPNLLLRTHITNVQIRELRRPDLKLPLAVVSSGTAYRRDAGVGQPSMFHRIEGFTVGEGTSLADLKGILTAFAERLFGTETPIRFRAHYFPLAKPGAALDIGCSFCVKPDRNRSGCDVCDHTGWVEAVECGMIHPDVFHYCGLDDEHHAGFTFGMGIERIVMGRYGISNFLPLYEHDVRFWAQF